MVSHPFQDEAVKWMGHGAVVVSWEKAKARTNAVRFVVSHPKNDEAVFRMGHPAAVVRGGKINARTKAGPSAPPNHPTDEDLSVGTP